MNLKSISGLLVMGLTIALFAAGTLDTILTTHEGFDVTGVGFIGAVWLAFSFFSGVNIFYNTNKNATTMSLVVLIGLSIAILLKPDDTQVFLKTEFQRALTYTAVITVTVIQLMHKFTNKIN